MAGLAKLRILANIKRPISVPRASIFKAPRQTRSQKLGFTQSAMIKYVTNMFTKDGKLKFWQAQKLVLMGTASSCVCLGIYRDGLETFITNLRLPFDKFSKMFTGDKTKEDEE